MDFRRIQLLLIGFFILFDLYLGLLLINRVDIRLASIEDDQSLTIDQQLQERGISIIPNIEDDVEEMPLVKASYNEVLNDEVDELKDQETEYDDSTKVLTSRFRQSIDLKGVIDAETTELSLTQQEAVKEVLKEEKWFIRGQEYNHFIYLPQSRTIVIRKTVENTYPIVGDDAEIRLILNDQYNIESYTQSYLDNFYPLEETYPVITANEALMIQDKRIDTMLPNDSTIERVVLGYASSYALDQYQIYAPVWHISYVRRDGVEGIVTIDARRGEVIYPATTVINQE